MRKIFDILFESIISEQVELSVRYPYVELLNEIGFVPYQNLPFVKTYHDEAGDPIGRVFIYHDVKNLDDFDEDDGWTSAIFYSFFKKNFGNTNWETPCFEFDTGDFRIEGGLPLLDFAKFCTIHEDKFNHYKNPTELRKYKHVRTVFEKVVPMFVEDMLRLRLKIEAKQREEEQSKIEGKA